MASLCVCCASLYKCMCDLGWLAVYFILDGSDINLLFLYQILNKNS